MGKIYIGGGTVHRTGAPNVIQVFDLSTQYVYTLAPCPVKLFTLVSINNQVVTVGGKTMSDEQVTNKLYSWNEATRQWEESLPPMLTPRHFHTTVVWNNYLIAFGGRIDDEDSMTDSVEVLNLHTNRWQRASSLLLKESGKHAVVTDTGKLYLLGGSLDNAVHHCELSQLVVSTVADWRDAHVWRRLEDTPSTDCAAVLFRGSLVIMGGRSYETNRVSSKILSYSSQDGWQHIGDLMAGRTACVAIALDYNTIFVVAGTVTRAGPPEWYSASTEIVTYS